jgi:tetratricopeptide (TPR) repeat protein
MEMAQDTGLDTSAVSAQLTRLVRQGILEKADPGDSKKALYQVAERFFNIWYLMRASRRVRAKLRWFVEFLRVFFDPGELEQMAWERIERHHSSWRGHPEEVETAFAYVLASGAKRDRFEDYLRRNCADMEEMWRSYVELLPDEGPDSRALAAIRRVIELNLVPLSEWAKILLSLADSSAWKEDAAAAMRRAFASQSNLVDFVSGFASFLRAAIELEPGSAWLWAALGTALSVVPNSHDEAESACRKAIELDASSALCWSCLGTVLQSMPARTDESEAAHRRAIKLDPRNAVFWRNLGVFLACRAGRPKDAEVAFRRFLEIQPDDPGCLGMLGVLLYCELAEPREAVLRLRRVYELTPEDPISAAVLAAALGDSDLPREQLQNQIDASRDPGFWDELLGLCRNYPPFGKLLLGICDLVQERDPSNRFVRLYRAVALAQLSDFPRASVALEDALTGDPIDLLALGQRALETFFAAAVKNGRVRDCLELIDKKEWKDAWRPICEALKAVEAGSAEYLKRIAVEIRHPALLILRRIAPHLPDLPERTG